MNRYFLEFFKIPSKINYGKIKSYWRKPSFSVGKNMKISSKKKFNIVYEINFPFFLSFLASFYILFRINYIGKQLFLLCP